MPDTVFKIMTKHFQEMPCLLVADADASDCVALKQAQLYKDFFYRHKEEDSSNPK